jgi:hypothetical protein
MAVVNLDTDGEAADVRACLRAGYTRFMLDSWARAFLRAIPLALWFFALAVVSVAGAVNWQDWRRNVAHFESDLDPRPREDEMFPGYHEDVQARVTAAADGLKWANRHYGGNLAITAAIGVGLIAVAIVYRRRVPRDRRPSWRTWLFIVPLVAGLFVTGLIWLGLAMRGAITG